MSRGRSAERTAEERELARKERARRRAEREGEPAPAQAEDPLDAAGALESPEPDDAGHAGENGQAPSAEEPGATAPQDATQQFDALAEDHVQELAVPAALEPPPGIEQAAAEEPAGGELDPAVAAEGPPGGEEDPAVAAESPGGEADPAVAVELPGGEDAAPEPPGVEADPAVAAAAADQPPAAEPSDAAGEPLGAVAEPPPALAEEPPPLAGALPAAAPAAHEPAAQPGAAAEELAAATEEHAALEDPQLAPEHEPDLPAPLAAPPPELEPAQVHEPQIRAVPDPPLVHEGPAAGEPPPRPRGRAARRRAGGGGERLPPLPSAARAPLAPRGRSHVARIGAVVALVLVIAAAIVLLVRSSSHGTTATTAAAPPSVHVLIPEGQTRLQIAQTAVRDGLTGNYRTASKRSPLLDPASYGAPAGTPTLEGFLFPATYDMDPKAPVGRLVEEQLIAFKENFGAKQIARAKALHITPYDLLIVASMVEREAQVPGDRAKIAAVIYNRLRLGMPLGIDATLYYAIEVRENIPTYTRELTESQLQMNSRYNTRTHTGLPPTPIANPGVASIEAAGAPDHVSYLYYVLGADGCGEHVFSTSEAQFQANAAAYQAAVRKNGGRVPACKKK